MSADAGELARLAAKARAIREAILSIVYRAGSGHVGGSLSQTDLLVALYYRSLRVDPARPDWAERDRFVLSKGHGGLGLAAILADLGFIPADELALFGTTGHRLGMHMDHGRVPGIEASTGSLGHGLGVAVGMALGAKHLGLPVRTVCMLSDGECYEGSTWEAALSAPSFGLGALTAIVDRNYLTMDGRTEELVPLEPLAGKWEAFGWEPIVCNGHDLAAVCAALDRALAPGRERPAVIVADTVKGKGVDFMENSAKWHYGALDSDAYARALASVRRVL